MITGHRLTTVTLAKEVGSEVLYWAGWRGRAIVSGGIGAAQARRERHTSLRIELHLGQELRHLLGRGIWIESREGREGRSEDFWMRPATSMWINVMRGQSARVILGRRLFAFAGL